MTRQSLGRQILERLIKDVDQRGLVEFRPRQEGNTLHLILAPNKKEGGAKEAKEKPHAPPKPAPPARAARWSADSVKAVVSHQLGLGAAVSFRCVTPMT